MERSMRAIVRVLLPCAVFAVLLLGGVLLEAWLAGEPGDSILGERSARWSPPGPEARSSAKSIPPTEASPSQAAVKDVPSVDAAGLGGIADGLSLLVRKHPGEGDNVMEVRARPGDRKLKDPFLVGLGRDDPSFRTPLGEYRITEVTHDPYWFVPSSSKMWVELSEQLQGKHLVPPYRVYDRRHPDKPNPNGLGQFWIGIEPKERPELKFLGIHGTNEPDSLGRSLGHGCIRVGDEDLRWLVGQIERTAYGYGVEVTLGSPPRDRGRLALELRAPPDGATRGGKVLLHVGSGKLSSYEARFPEAFVEGGDWRIERIDHHPYWDADRILYPWMDGPGDDVEPYFYQQDELQRTDRENTCFLGTRVVVLSNGEDFLAIHGTNLSSLYDDEDPRGQDSCSIRMHNSDLEQLVKDLTRPLYARIRLEVKVE